jgi:hypothetical protein
MDLTTLLVIGLIIVVVVLLISRNRSGYGGGPVYRNQTGGAERPTYDDTGYTSSGSIGGAGGSSGTGSVRAKARAVGDISGIDADKEADVPAPGSIGKGKGGSRTRQMSDGGLRGKTRGDDSETIPNRESAAQQDAEKQGRS